MDTAIVSELHSFTSKLLTRYQALSMNREDQSLVLGDSLLLYTMVQSHTDTLPTQLVVIGPTQSGKSTVVNLLLGQNEAEASPLAGFTRHAQGFSSGPLDAAAVANIDSLLPWLERSADGQLSDDDLDEFILKTVDAGQAQAPMLTVWDTPDFDSVSSRGYRDTVPQLCAIADAIIMVVSREKYADQSVWQLLQLLVPTGKPITLLINKLQDANREALRSAVQDKLKQYGFDQVQLESLPQLALDQPNELYQNAIAKDLGTTLRHWALEQKRETNRASLSAFLQQHWPQWTQPVHDELTAQSQWQKEIDAVYSSLQDRYTQEYLDQTHHSDALQRAMARLLELLEIPAVAGTLGRLRTIVTWPARQLGKFVKKQDSDDVPASDLEHDGIARLVDHGLLVLSDRASDHKNKSSGQQQRWWTSLEVRLQSARSELKQLAEQQIETHQNTFEPKIEAAAQSLYRHLQGHPTTLNGLRAARVSTDAAAVVLAVKTGGLGMSDLVLAPAMLAFSSMLTEGAVGQYMKKIEQELRDAQLNSADQYVWSELREALTRLPESVDTSELLNISEAELQTASSSLEQLS